MRNLKDLLFFRDKDFFSYLVNEALPAVGKKRRKKKEFHLIQGFLPLLFIPKKEVCQGFR